ncbi:MAG TPA: serine O-acetyltransferase, partial [Geminicoccus sp.]
AGPTDVRRLDDRMMPVAGGDGMTMAAATKHKHLTLVSPEAQGDISETLWRRLRWEAEEACAKSPMLAPLFLDSIINQPSFESAMFHRIAARLKNDVISQPLILQAFHRASSHEPAIAQGLQADITAVYDRDPACERLIEPFLYFKGFHAIQAHRLTHWLWENGERDFALYLQSRSSEVFQTDIHPAARIGKGILLDHATGLVVGETAVIEDDVSLLQGVTLGGTGKEAGDRHPKVRKGVMIGAGAKILGNIEIGACARIAAGSVVLNPVAPRTTVAGVPAKAVKVAPSCDTSRSADEILSEMSYAAFDYTI